MSASYRILMCSLVLAVSDGCGSWVHARLFALMNMAQADAAIANQKWKYTYNFWRPVTAIRWTQGYGNPNTEPDPTWRPLLNTPPYPDFPSALSVLTGAATSVLREFFGTDDIAFSATVTVGSLPLPAPLDPLPAKTITRSYTSLSQAASEAQMSRVYAGLHYREACAVGGLHGTKIGRFVVRTELRPVRGKS